MNSSNLSVVTTVYNGELYFNRAVPNILQQTYTNFEFIIVDDGSTDCTAQQLRELTQNDQRVRVLSPGRLGRSQALNYAIEQTQADYIAIQDFDDISYPERLRLQVEFLEAHPDVGLIACHYVLVDDNRQEQYIRMPATEHQQLVRTMAKCVPFAHTLVTYRRKAWMQAGGYPDVDSMVDLHLWIAFVRLGWRLATIPQVLGEHWVHPNSFWHQQFNYIKQQQKLAQIQWQAIQELSLPLWMGVYPLGRYLYSYMPKTLKRYVRRTLAQSKEKDMAKR